MSVDLHTHTTFSDGTLTPEQLIEKADYQRLTAVAITDHDEIGALKYLNTLNSDKNVIVVNGAEFSIDVDLKGNAHLHMLGLFLDIENDELNNVLIKLKNARRERAYTIIQKLKEQGIPITKQEIDDVIGMGSAGRPHIARLLIQKKIVSNVWEAFSKYLSKGKPAYVSKQKLPLKDAIKLIHDAHGLAILAHPISLKHRRYKDTDVFLRELKYIGLDGVEAYYATHSPKFTKFLKESAARYSLLVSGGSDFHGKVKPDTELGIGKGNLDVPDDIYFSLKEAAQHK